jgi:ABC-2 type transport system permease protein/sodium transport system permease protein
LVRLIRKELSEILRDRRTIITMFLMPVLLYPLLTVAFRQFFLATRINAEEIPYRLGFASQQEEQFFLNELQRGQKELNAEQKKKSSWLSDLMIANPSLVDPRIEQHLLAGSIELGVRIPELANARTITPRSQPWECQLIYRKSSPESREAVRYVERLLAAAQRRDLRRQVQRHKDPVPPVVLQPSSVPLQDPEQVGMFALKPLIPLILILMTITGAVYPAIDLTAGECERGTLEILVAAPVPRLGLLFAKYVCVLTIAVLTALVNLVSMFLTIALSGLGPVIFQGSGPSVGLMVELFLLLLLFAAFYSAVLLCLTSFARSFKEAQAYVIPLMVVTLSPGFISLLPVAHLSGWVTVLPLINIVLLARDLLESQVHFAVAGVVIASTLIYALAAIAVAARIFGAEGVLYSDQSNWADLWRRPRSTSQVPTVGGALLLAALMFPIQFGLQGVFGLVMGPNLTAPGLILSVVYLALVSAAVFGGVPLAVAVWQRLQLRSAFLLKAAPFSAYAGALLLGLSLWPLILEIMAWMYNAGLTTLDQVDHDRILRHFAQLRINVPGWLMVGALASLGIFEELFFRGYLFSALRARGGPGPAVWASAFLFALYHLVVTDIFALERLLPSFVMGLVLGWVCLQSGSVVPGMLLHTLHDGILAYLAFDPTVSPAGRNLVRPEYLGIGWLVAGGVGCALGVAFLIWASSRLKRTSEEIGLGGFLADEADVEEIPVSNAGTDPANAT